MTRSAGTPSPPWHHSKIHHRDDRNWTRQELLPLISTHLPLLFPKIPSDYHTTQFILTFHHASQRRRIFRQRPHWGRPGRSSRCFWRRKYPCLLQLLTKSSALTIWQATLQHTKNNVAPMPEIEKGEGTTRLPHLPLFVAPAPQMTAKKEKECFERKANTNMR